MRLDHCLFGYNDGHRLLASSFPLGEETAFLTELSDLAPGVIFGNSKGYWTGLPVPSIGRYVLMYTWPAPEMPRPGCVWTHALFLEPEFLESTENLSILQDIIVRPNGLMDSEKFKHPLEVNVLSNNTVNMPANSEIIKKLINSLYGNITTYIEISLPGELDEPLFAVWSQQWPRLRRNFRFQTAASRTSRSLGSTRFDITVLLTQPEYKTQDLEDDIPYWLTTAMKDASIGTKGHLRRFLWKYGQDVHKQRGSFKPLAEISVLAHSVHTNSAQNIINIVSNAFPTKTDASYLKQDLVDGVLASCAQIDLIKFLALHNNRYPEMFPFLTGVGITNLLNLWPQQGKEFLNLVSITSELENSYAKRIFEILINAIQTPSFWPLSIYFPDIRKLVVKHRPEFLIANEPLLDNPGLIDLIPLVPANTEGLDKFIHDLMSRNDINLVNIVFDNYPDIAAKQVMINLKRSFKVIPEVWKRELFRRNDLLLQTEIISLVSNPDLLYEYVDALGWLSKPVIVAGLEPWYDAFVNVFKDSNGTQADMLGCFYIVLALKSGGDKARYVIEHSFAGIHKKILRSKLPSSAREMLLTQLPSLGWIRDWDLGYRLRLAVAKRYIHYQWPVESYVNLSSNSKEQILLANTASHIDGGYKYSNAARD